jgi:zinc protease
MMQHPNPALTTTDPATQGGMTGRIKRLIGTDGLEAWHVEDHTVPIIALRFAFMGGAAQESAEKAGAVGMLATLLDEGAGARDAQAFHEALDDKAIELSFDADKDAVRGSLRCLSRHLDEAAALLRDALVDARLDEDAIQRVRGQMLANLKRETTDPNAIAGKAWITSVYGNHPYAQPSQGTLESLSGLARTDLLTLRKRLLARDRLKIALVGAINADQAIRFIDTVFAELPAKAALSPVAEIEAGKPGDIIVLPLDVPQSVIRFGKQGIDRHDPDYIPAILVNHVLGGGTFQARLFREVREKRGLTYSIWSSLTTFAHGALFNGATSTRNDRVREAIDVIGAEIAAMGQKGPSEDELLKAKRYLIGSYPLQFDTSGKVAGSLLTIQLDNLGIDWWDRRNGLIEAVTPEDARRTAARLFGDPQQSMTIVGKPEGL